MGGGRDVAAQRLDWIEAEYRAPREFVTLVYASPVDVQPRWADIDVPAGQHPVFVHDIHVRITV